MSLFNDNSKRKYVIGLVHLLPLPGTPLHQEGNFKKSLEKALRDVSALQKGGADGCLLQTSERIYPSGDDTDYARLASFAIIAHEVRKAVGKEFKLGVQMMWNCITPSLAVAKACEADFTRNTVMFGTSTSPYGLISANPEKVQAYRKKLGLENLTMIAEIDGYHYTWFGPEISIQEKAAMAIKVGADAVEIVHPDEAVNNQMVHDIKKSNPAIRVVLGGKTNLENVSRRMKEADAVLVGAYFEKEGWGGFVDEERVRDYVAAVRAIEG